MYGSTEVGVVVVNYPGFSGYEVRPGALGKPAPGWEVAIVGDDGAALGPDRPGEIAVRRKGGWFPLKDRGWVDADGYFHHSGRSDDVIISAGWTMSAVEIEDVLLKHPDVRDAAVVGIADERRGTRGEGLRRRGAARPGVRARDPGVRQDAAEPPRVSRGWSRSWTSCRRRRPGRPIATPCANEDGPAATLALDEGVRPLTSTPRPIGGLGRTRRMRSRGRAPREISAGIFIAISSSGSAPGGMSRSKRARALAATRPR